MWLARWKQKLPGGVIEREGEVYQAIMNEHNQLSLVIKPFKPERGFDEGPAIHVPVMHLEEFWNPNRPTPKKKKKSKQPKDDRPKGL